MRNANTNRLLPTLCMVLALFTFAAFWPVRSNGFVEYDDQDYITSNSIVREGLTWNGILWAFSTAHASNWHPLTWISHMSDVQIFGLWPGGHHLITLALHVLNGVLLLVLLHGVTRQVWPSAFAAALFALHPLRVESVAWAAERKDVLCGLFFLLTLLAYAKYAQVAGTPRTASQQPTGKEKWAWYAGTIIFFCLGLMSKPMLVTLPFLLLVLDFWPLKRIVLGQANSTPSLSAGAFRQILSEKIPFLLLSVASSVMTLRVQERAKLHFQHLEFADRMGNAIISYVRYLLKALWPSDLAVLYPHPGHWAARYVVLALFVLLLITGVAVWKRRSAPWLMTGWLWYLGLLVPVIGVVQVGVQSMADRYTYLPMIGLAIIVAWGFESLAGRSRGARMGVALVSLAALGLCIGATHRQVLIWRDTETLFAHAVSVTERNWVAHANLGTEALRQYQARLAEMPYAAEKVREQQTSLLEAVVYHCSRSIEFQPGFADVHVIAAKALVELGKIDLARQHLEIALRLSPNDAEAHENMAEVCYREQNVRQAVVHYRAALKSRPDWDSVLNNLAWILATDRDANVRNGGEAIQLAEQACRISNHTNIAFLQTLGAAYAEAGDFQEALFVQKQALSLSRGNNLQTEIEKSQERIGLYERRLPLRSP